MAGSAMASTSASTSTSTSSTPAFSAPTGSTAKKRAHPQQPHQGSSRYGIHGGGGDEEDDEEEDEEDGDDDSAGTAAVAAEGPVASTSKHSSVSLAFVPGKHTSLLKFSDGFWKHQFDVAETIHEDFKTPELPLARVKRVMKTDPEVAMIASEVPVILEKACQIFISDLTARAYIESPKRRTLTKTDVAKAVKHSDIFDFLIDVVPGEGGLEGGNAGNNGTGSSKKDKGKERERDADKKPPQVGGSKKRNGEPFQPSVPAGIVGQDGTLHGGSSAGNIHSDTFPLSHSAASTSSSQHARTAQQPARHADDVDMEYQQYIRVDGGNDDGENEFDLDLDALDDTGSETLSYTHAVPKLEDIEMSIDALGARAHPHHPDDEDEDDEDDDGNNNDAVRDALISQLEQGAVAGIGGSLILPSDFGDGIFNFDG